MVVLINQGRRGVSPLLLCGVCLLCFGLMGCRGSNSTETLTVFAAASLTDAFEDIGEAFMIENPNVDIVFSFAGSSALATQIIEGAPADVFASANEIQMQVVVDAGRITDRPQIFATNRLVVALPTENNANILSLDDLTNEGVNIVIAAPGVPVRAYTDTMLDLLSADPAFGHDFREGVMRNIVSEESNVRQVLIKIILGEADAGIVYQSDITSDATQDVTALNIPDAFNTQAHYPIALVEGSDNATLAQQFIAFALSSEGQTILGKWGFIPIYQP